MKFTDVIILGWYKILDKTIYSRGIHKGEIGPREHSFFITFLLHGMNVWSIFRYLFSYYFDAKIHYYWGLISAVIVFFIGYLIYFKKGRADEIIMLGANNLKSVFYIIGSLIYAVASSYIMLKVGDYVRGGSY